MIGLWISAGALCLMVAVVLGQALRRGAEGEGSDDMAVYRDQLAEIERDAARGLLSEVDAGRLRVEIGRRLLEADRRGGPGTRMGAGGRGLPGWAAPVAIALALGLALWIYGGGGPLAGIGAPAYPDLPLTARLAEAEAAYANRPTQEAAEAARGPWVAPEGTDAQTLDLIGQLRAAVAGRPEDLTGHELLADNEAKLGNFAAARLAQEAVVRIKGPSAGALDHLRAAELAIYAAGGLVTATAEAHLGAVLGLDPANGAARFWIGLMAAQVGRADRAYEVWAPLLAEGPPDAPWIAPIQSQIEAVAQAAGVPFDLATAAGPGPSAEDMAAAAEMAPEDRQAMIAQMVEGLEARLLAEGGPVEDWVKLVTSLGVLGEEERRLAALARARGQFAADPGALSALQAAEGAP